MDDYIVKETLREKIETALTFTLAVILTPLCVALWFMVELGWFK